MLSGVNESSRLKPQPRPHAVRVRRWWRATFFAGVLASPAQVLAVDGFSDDERAATPAAVGAATASPSTTTAPAASASGTTAPTASASTAAASAASASAAAPWARAYAQGQWSAAIELLEAIPEASRTAWHWLHLARALEKRDRLVEAFGAYERLQDLATEAADVPGMKDVERQGKTEAGALSHRIPWAEVRLGGDLPPGALVFVDQQWLDPARLRSPYPVNPGWHTFLVESNGVVLAARRTFFEEGQSRLVPLAALDASGAGSSAAVLTPAAASAAMSPVEASGPAASSPVPARRALTWRASHSQFDTDKQDNLRTATYVSLGVGSVGMVVGTGFLIAALNTPEPRRSCSAWGCTSNEGDATSAFRARAGAATLGYAVGAAGLITSGVLWVLHGKREARSTVALGKVELEPRIHPTGATLTGTF